MMEFTVSRLTAMICGAIILSAVIVPFTDVMDGREDCGYQSDCDSVAKMIDAFNSSKTEELVLSMNTLLPSADCRLSFEGHTVKLFAGEKEFRSFVKTGMKSDRIYGFSDIVTFVKTDGSIIASCSDPRCRII